MNWGLVVAPATAVAIGYGIFRTVARTMLRPQARERYGANPAKYPQGEALFVAALERKFMWICMSCAFVGAGLSIAGISMHWFG